MNNLWSWAREEDGRVSASSLLQEDNDVERVRDKRNHAKPIGQWRGKLSREQGGQFNLRCVGKPIDCHLVDSGRGKRRWIVWVQAGENRSRLRLSGGRSKAASRRRVEELLPVSLRDLSRKVSDKLWEE